MDRGLEFAVAGETMVANANRSLFWPRGSTLFVADVHLGKAAAFRSQSIPLPHGTTDVALARFDQAVCGCGCKRVVILGDLWHDRRGHSDGLLGKLITWRSGYPEIEFVLVTGNHDLNTGVSLHHGGFDELEEFRIGPFVCRHHPEPSAEGYVLCGHIHPAVSLEGPGSPSLKLPCFWFGSRVGVLPAFGEFTGSAEVRPVVGDIVMVVGGDRVFSVGRDPVRTPG